MRRYGWRRDLHDDRDVIYSASPRLLEDLPPRVDLSSADGMDFPVYDQGSLGSCTANALCCAVRHRRSEDDCDPSRLYLYYQTRALEETISEDSGATIRDTVKASARGICSERIWPYEVSRFADAPSDDAVADARRLVVSGYSRVRRSSAQLRGALAHGNPVVFGFLVYEGMESDSVARTGVVEMPSSGEECLGGHAVVLVGYDDLARRFRVRNSWGSDWGDGGYFTLPYEYVLSDLSSDFWVIDHVWADTDGDK